MTLFLAIALAYFWCLPKFLKFLSCSYFLWVWNSSISH